MVKSEKKALLNKKAALALLKLEIKFEKNIDRGVAYLDKRFGKKEWLTKVNEHILDLGNQKICVMGQILGDFFSEFLDDEKAKMDEKKSAKYGFYLGDDETSTTVHLSRSIPTEDEWDEQEAITIDHWDLLTNLWFCRIRALRKMRKVAYTG